MRLGWRFFVFGECFQEPIDEGQVGAFSGRMEFDFSSFDDDEPNHVKDSASSESLMKSELSVVHSFHRASASNI